MQYLPLVQEWDQWLENPDNALRMRLTAPDLETYSMDRSYLGPSWTPERITAPLFVPWMLVRIIAWLVPDSLLGIRIAYAGFWHDRLYLIGGGPRRRWRADRIFLLIIWDQIQKSAAAHWRRSVAYLCSPIFFLAVMLIGWTCFKYTKRSK